MAGSFNPPHLGHLQVLKLAREELKLDEVWLLPLPATPIKALIPQFSMAEKIALCLDLIGDVSWLRVFTDHEKAINGHASFIKRFISYINCINNSYEDGCDRELFKICGSDSFRHLIFIASLLRVAPPFLFPNLRAALSAGSFIVSPRWKCIPKHIPPLIELGWGFPGIRVSTLVETDRLRPYHQLSSRKIRAALIKGDRGVHGLPMTMEARILANLNVPTGYDISAIQITAPQ